MNQIVDSGCRCYMYMNESHPQYQLCVNILLLLHSLYTLFSFWHLYIPALYKGE
jgi:hypothetical protein